MLRWFHIAHICDRTPSFLIELKKLPIAPLGQQCLQYHPTRSVLFGNTMIIGLLAFMVFLAFLLAFWEIQIEGKDGWAAKLPAWRIEKGWLVKLAGGRPITGYHLFMTLFLIATVHLPLFFVPWSWRLESLLLGFYVGMVFLEDFLWFVLNPHYGIKNFRKGKIWWHKTWWGPVPALYWFLLIIVIVLIYFGRTAI
jgi:hypothetical protein